MARRKPNPQRGYGGQARWQKTADGQLHDMSIPGSRISDGQHEVFSESNQRSYYADDLTPDGDRIVGGRPASAGRQTQTRSPGGESVTMIEGGGGSGCEDSKDVVGRIRAAKTPEERTSIAFNFAKGCPDEAQKLGWENPMLAWQLYQEAQELGLPLGELGLEGGHTPSSAKQSINNSNEEDPPDGGSGGSDNMTDVKSNKWSPDFDPFGYKASNRRWKKRQYEESPEGEHESRTGEWKSPVTGEWYKKDAETGEYKPMVSPMPQIADLNAHLRHITNDPRQGNNADTGSPYGEVAKAVDGVSEGLQDTDKRQIAGMGWDQPVLDVRKWKRQDPLGYEKARREAFAEGREGPRMSDIPEGVWDFGDYNLPKGGIELDPSKQGKDAWSNVSAASKTREAIPVDSGGTQKLRHTAMAQPESDRGFINDLGAFIFGDSTLGQENILSRILTGLFA